MKFGKSPGRQGRIGSALLAIALVALLLCTGSMAVLASPGAGDAGPRMGNQTPPLAPGAQGEPSKYQDWPVIAALENVGDNADETAEFTLDACTAMRLYAVGELTQYTLVDYGTIENAATGQVIWQMYFFETDPAGGDVKNRRVDRAISLPAGTYRLRFRTNASHSFDNWTGRPPTDEFWGIVLYEDVAPSQGPALCWERARPEDLGWSPRGLEQIIPELEEMNCAALMIVTDGKVVFEWGNTANNFFAHSMRKSLLSALYGIYVAEGKIDLSKTLEELGIDDKTPLTPEEKQATVADLIQARSGVYIPAAGEVASMRAARPKRGSHAPGTFWYYNNWDFNALGTIFDQETGEENIYVAFQRRIADPIGMEDFRIDNLAYTYEYSMHPYYGIRISARDLARFGQLFLQEGAWQGEQIIPAEWVEESTYPHSLTGGLGTYSGYGYMWWIAAQDQWGIQQGSFAASGAGGHTLEVLPDINTVIVFRVNTDDPSVEWTGSDAVDQLIAHLLLVTNRSDTPYNRARVPMIVWAVLVAVSLVVFVVDLLRGAPGTVLIKLAWGLVLALFGPLGLAAYLLSYRPAHRSPPLFRAGWRALEASLYSGVGYAIAWVLTVLIFFAVWPSRHPLATLAISYGVPFVFGLVLFRAPLLRKWTASSYGRALRRSLLAEAISMNLALAGMLPMGAWGLDHWMPRTLNIGSWLFWAILVLTMSTGALLVYPYNLWLVRRGMPGGLLSGPSQEGDIETPTWKNAWGAFLLSLLTLVAGIAVVVLFLS
jgi:CubicO group peptidase (beta-lactamase class C family)